MGIDHHVRRLRTLRTTVTDDGIGAAGTKTATFAKRRLVDVRRRIVSGQIPGADVGLGARRSNLLFWNAPRRRPTWTAVAERIELLHVAHPADLDHFVTESLARTTDPMVVLGLARHPLTASTMRDWLADGGADDLVRRAHVEALFVGAVAAASTLLLDAEETSTIRDALERSRRVPERQSYEFQESLGWHLASGTARPVCSGEHRRHRLVIVEHFGDLDSIVPLLAGPERTTVIATSDTFGKADFTKCRSWPGIGVIAVEHVRSRIGRFSQHYIDLHEATAEVARRAGDEIRTIPELDMPDLAPFVDVAMADFLFFQALKLRAIEELLADDSFDDIIFGVGTRRRSVGFITAVTAVPGVCTDDRVRIASISRSAADRGRFREVVHDVTDPGAAIGPLQSAIPESLVMERFTEDARRLGAGISLPAAGDRPTVAVATANAPSYDDSTASYVAELESIAAVRLICLAGDAGALREHLDDPSIPVDEIDATGARFTPLAEMLAPRLFAVELPAASTSAERTAASAYLDTAHRLGREVVGPVLARAMALHHWFTTAEQKGVAPAALLVTPQRTIWVGVAAAVARRFGIPSIAVEPHAQDANYSRYIKIAADYYGVMSDYFREQTAPSFGIERERIRTIGSPRQVAPTGYDPDRERQAARRAYTDRTGRAFDPHSTVLSFFCQPSAWTQVSQIWDVVLDAAEETGSLILLKTHPEESVSRMERYLEQANDRGAGDSVVVLDTDAETAIALADIVLTAYSAGAFDSIMRRTPVVVVAPGDSEYPVDLHAILGAPVARSAAELSAVVTDFEHHPAEFRRRAEAVLERESHFTVGPGPGLRSLVAHAIAGGSAGVRDAAALPSSLFLDPPHPTFPV